MEQLVEAYLLAVLLQVLFGVSLFVEKIFLARALKCKFLRRGSDHLDYEVDLLDLVLARKDGSSQVQLGDEACEAPHVDFGAVLESEDNFGGSVIAALNVCVDLMAVEAAGAEVDQLDAGLLVVLEHHVFWLDVAVDDFVFRKVVEGVEDLNGDFADELVLDSPELVLLEQVVEVGVELFENYALVTPEEKGVFDGDDVADCLEVVVLDELQDGGLQGGLLFELFLIFDNF